MIFRMPEMFLLLLILPVLWKILSRAQRLQIRSAEVLRGKRNETGCSQKNILFQLGSVTLLIIALAQPAWDPQPKPVPIKNRDLVIALDISRSMLAEDVFPTRLDAAKISIYESLPFLQGQRIGLITFAGSATMRVPLTRDHNFVRYMLERVRPSDAETGSTALQAAVEKAMDAALIESKETIQDIIFFTDGEDHLSDLEKTSKQLRECGAPVLIIGLGDPLTGARIPSLNETNQWVQYKGRTVFTRLNEENLIKLAEECPNVMYHSAGTRPFDLVSLYQQLISTTSEENSVSDDIQMIYKDGYPVFIALALILWLAPWFRLKQKLGD